MNAQTKVLGILMGVAAAAALSLAACSQAPSRPEGGRGVNRVIQSAAPSFSGDGSDFSKAMQAFGVRSYSADLHAHHFMYYKPSKKSGLTQEKLGPGACDIKGSFPEDDAKPCRNDSSGSDQFVDAPGGLDKARADRLGYFPAACEYGRTTGQLDILFVTPHTKNNQGDGDTDTLQASLAARHALLADMNRSYGGAYYCGLGQEASSISKGNHVGILGHFPNEARSIRPYFFPAGAFDQFYPEVKRRTAAGETTILQFNHPDVGSDLSWDPFDKIRAGKRGFKDSLRDYGLDDFAPMACVIKPQGAADRPAECDGSPAPALSAQLTNDLMQATYAKMRDAAGDAFKLIEVVSPGDAAMNPTVTFAPTHRRASGGKDLGSDGDPNFEGFGDQPITNPNYVSNGLRDFIFYLNMGFKLGPTADQDNHHMNYGTSTASRTGVLASSLAEDDIFSALSSRRVFASEDRNAKLLLFTTDEAAGGAHLMGDSVETSAASIRLKVGYQDPDPEDQTAEIHVFYYRQGEPLPFAPPATKLDALRIVSFKGGQATLPTGAPSSYSDPSPNADQVLIRSGEVKELELPLQPGSQYVFVELTQTQDLDKLWSAPLWVTRR